MPVDPDIASTEPAPPFAYPVFRAVWVASLVSNFGGLIQSVGASWLMISLAASPQLIALVQAATTLPIMLLSLPAGAIADNFDRRRVMILSQTFMLLVSAALAAFTWLGLLTPWWLLAFTFLIGCGTALNGPAWQASVGDLVPRKSLPSAIALNSMAFNIARSAGPALGGVIVALAGAATAFLINAVSYVGLIAVLARWKPALPLRDLPPEQLGSGMAAGLRYIAMSPKLQVILLRASLFGLAAAAVPALMPLIARDLVGGGPLTYGVLLGAFGIGAIGGALFSSGLRARLSPEQVIRAAVLALSAGAAVAAISRDLSLTCGGLLIGGAGWVLALSTFNVSVQLSTPRWVVGRALALYQMAAFGGMAAGSWLFGWVAEHRDVPTALLGAAGVQLLSFVLGLVLPVSPVADLDLDPRPWDEPDTAIPVEGRSGPIVITIDYQIAPSDIQHFLAVMNERRRIRLRDGARHWTLLRDLNDAEKWVERYHVPTWHDYVRHNQRRTGADAANSQQIAALHCGTEPPVVHRRIERQTTILPPELQPAFGGVTHAIADPGPSI
ncbi:MAG: MFS transporter [Sphingomicrobium sp.]